MPTWLTPQAVVFFIVFILALIVGPLAIPLLRRLKFGQTVRQDGPATHLKKKGTPVMGGLIFILPLTAVCCYLGTIQPKIFPVLFLSLGFGLVGLADDMIKVLKKSKDGLLMGQKTFWELLVAAAFTFYVYYFTDTGTKILVPFAGTGSMLELSWIFIPFTILALYFTTNAVNFSDGVDGLCAGITLIVMVFFTIVASTRPEWDYLKLFSSAVAGGCLGFLAFNLHPAKVFMGDTGSLALGGAVAGIAVLMRMPLIIIIAGFVYVMEIVSVAIQVASFKSTGKRVFRMAPIHHHFELAGWKETRVVAVFWSITALCCMIAAFALHL